MIEFLQLRGRLQSKTKTQPGVTWYDLNALHLRDVAREMPDDDDDDPTNGDG